MKGYLPNGPTVWRVSYCAKFEQFETLEKALNYMKNQLITENKHMLLLQKVNLKEVELPKPDFKGVV